MKSMKNILRLFFFTTILFVNQQAKAQARFGLKAGVGLSDIHVNITGEDSDILEGDYKTKKITAFHIGGIVAFPLSENLNLETGLLFSRKGFAEGEDLEPGEYDRYFLSYLEAPFHLIYHKNQFQVFAGPYLAYGLSGVNKWKYDGKVELEDLKPTTKTINLDDDDDTYYFNAIDYGLDFGVGYQVGPVLLNASYSLGLGDIQPKYEETGDPLDLDIDITMNYRVFSISGTYYFGKEE